MSLDENPYAAPPTDVEPKPRVIGVRSARPGDLRKIAIYQKGVIICLLAYFVLLLALTFAPHGIELAIGIFYLATALAAIVFVFLLAIKVYRLPLGILLGLLTLIPCLGLVALVIMNSKATEILRANGLEVGLFGADLSGF